MKFNKLLKEALEATPVVDNSQVQPPQGPKFDSKMITNNLTQTAKVVKNLEDQIKNLQTEKENLNKNNKDLETKVAYLEKQIETLNVKLKEQADNAKKKPTEKEKPVVQQASKLAVPSTGVGTSLPIGGTK